MKKRLSTTLLLSLLLICIAGAGSWYLFSNVLKGGDEIEAFVEQHLANKYHQSFEVQDVKYTANTGRYSLHVQVKDQPARTFEVTMMSEEDTHPSDTYPEMLWRFEAMDALHQVTTDLFEQPHHLFANIGLPVKKKATLDPTHLPTYQDLLNQHAADLSQYLEVLVAGEPSDDSIFKLVQYLRDQHLANATLELNIYEAGSFANGELEGDTRSAFYALKGNLQKSWITSIRLEEREMDAIASPSDISRYKRPINK